MLSTQSFNSSLGANMHVKFGEEGRIEQSEGSANQNAADASSS